MCFYVGRGFFPRTAVLYNPPSNGGGLFGREGLSPRDAELLAVHAGIKIVLTQVADRELLEGFAAD